LGWCWFLGSVVFFVVVAAELKCVLWNGGILIALIVLFMVLLLFMFLMSIFRTLIAAVGAMANIDSGDSYLSSTMETYGKDEISVVGTFF
ncbi:HAMP domain-containing protein, partial [Pseudomonas syringae group genomosp. 7]